DCRRRRRPVRRLSRDGGRRAALCRRPFHDALLRNAAVARYRRRRADRLWPVRLLLQPGAVGVQQVAAGRAARHRARRRHGGRVVRPIPVRAVRRRHDRQVRLAGRTHRVCRADAADRAAGARTVDPAAGNEQRADRRRSVVQDRACGSFRSSLLRAAGARLLHLRFPACLHYRASAGLPGRSRPLCPDRWL
ncbi:hypothetical protein KXV85_003304, partial [Aspergillus fumigatus]